MRHLLALLLLAATAGTAGAAEVSTIILGGGNVVEFDVTAVVTPPSLPGLCAVTGVATRVWEGSAYRRGQPLFLTVPCASYGLIPANVRLGGIVPVNVGSLRQSHHGIARLGDDGALIWQDGGKSYGLWGQVAGYRVLDPRMLPVMPS
jgi:hypothetical protein